MKQKIMNFNIKKYIALFSLFIAFAAFGVGCGKSEESKNTVEKNEKGNTVKSTL